MTHHHRHHHKDNATLFRERSLRSITFRRQFEKWLKIVLCVIALLMILAVILLYL